MGKLGNDLVAAYYYWGTCYNVYGCYEERSAHEPIREGLYDFYDIHDNDTDRCINLGEPCYDFPSRDDVVAIVGALYKKRSVQSVTMERVSNDGKDLINKVKNGLKCHDFTMCFDGYDLAISKVIGSKTQFYTIKLCTPILSDLAEELEDKLRDALNKFGVKADIFDSITGNSTACNGMNE